MSERISFNPNAPEKETNRLEAELKNPKVPITFEKGRSHIGHSLNGVEFSTAEIPDWSQVVDTDLVDEPNFEFGPGESHLKKSAGIIVLEPDGRVWIYEPSNHFGGYEHTFPKGRPEKGLSLQQSAKKEVLEEVGLLIDITGFLGDYAKTTTKTRYYIGKRIGGDPGMADNALKPGEPEEVWNVKLVPKEQLNDYLNTRIDQKIALDLLKKLKTEE